MRFLYVVRTCVILAFAMGIMACNSNGKSSDSPLEEGVEQVGEAVMDALKSDREELRADIEETQAAMDENITALKEKMEMISDNAKKVELEKQIDALKQHNQTLVTKLGNLATVTSEEEFNKFETEARDLLTQVRQSMVDVE